MEIRLVQKSVLEVFEGNEIISQTIVANDVALGRFHDANMLLKGWTVDRMTKIHSDEVKMTEEQKKEEIPQG